MEEEPLLNPILNMSSVVNKKKIFLASGAVQQTR